MGSSAFHIVQELPREPQPFSCLRFLVLYLWQRTLVSHLIFSLTCSLWKELLAAHRAVSFWGSFSSSMAKFSWTEIEQRWVCPVLLPLPCCQRENWPWYRFRHSEIRLVVSGILWKMQVYNSYANLMKQKLWEWGPRMLVFTNSWNEYKTQ